MHSKKNLGKKYKSSTHYIISALIPYTEANLKLSFKPNQFFNDLEKLDELKVSRKSVQTNYYRLKQRGIVKTDNKGAPILTKQALRIINIDKPKKLEHGKYLIVAFDVPEKERNKRDALRLLLKELSFKQVQLSVWETEYNHKERLRFEVRKYGLEKYVTIYESAKIKI